MPRFTFGWPFLQVKSLLSPLPSLLERPLVRIRIRDLSSSISQEASFKVTPNLRGCLPEKKSYARCVLGNHHNLYIDIKVIKCRIR